MTMAHRTGDKKSDFGFQPAYEQQGVWIQR